MAEQAGEATDYYLSLVVGNTRLHFAQVRDDKDGDVVRRWDTQHLAREVRRWREFIIINGGFFQKC